MKLLSGGVSSTNDDFKRGVFLDYNLFESSTEMSLTVSPIGAIPAPPANSVAGSSAKLTSPPAAVTDTVQLSSAGQAVVLSPEEIMLDETDSYFQLVQAAADHDPVAGSLLNALNSVPPPKVP